jgi:hypothetical protein
MAWLIRWILRDLPAGHNLTASRLASWTSPAIARTFISVARDLFRQLRGHRAAVGPANARMIHRSLCGRFIGRCASCCVDVARRAALSFDKGMVSNQNDRLSNSRKPPELLFD